MNKILLGLETKEEYPPKIPPQAVIVGVSKYSIDELIDHIRKFMKRSFTYYRVFNENDDIPIENNGMFYFRDEFVYKYTSHMSNSYEVWMPSEEPPLLINHLKQDLRILISPIRP